MKSNSFPFIEVASGSLLHLQESLNSKSRLEFLLIQLGWRANIASEDLVSINTALGLNANFTQLTQLVDDLRYQRSDVLQISESIFTIIKSTFQDIDRLISISPISSIKPFNQANFWSDFVSDLVPLLLANELKRSSPITYTILFLTGVIKEARVLPTGSERFPYTRVTFDWNALADFLSNPSKALSQRYGWGSEQILDYESIVQDLARLAALFPIASRLSATPGTIATRYYNDADLENQDITSLILPFVSGILPDSSGAVELGLSLTPIPGVAKSGQLPAGFLLAPYLHGGYQNAIALRSDLLLEFIGSFAIDNNFGVEVFHDTINLIANIGNTPIGAELRLIGKPKEPIRFFGTDNSSRLELSGYLIGVEVIGTVTKPEVILKAGTGPTKGSERLSLYIVPREGDSFISRVFGDDPIRIDIAGAITWSSRTGLGINGAVGLRLQSTQHRSLGPVAVQAYALEIASRTGEPLVASGIITAHLNLGPVSATIEEIGLAFRLINNRNRGKGLLDNLDVAWGYKPPIGVKIEVDSDTITGGGYLYFNPAAKQYAGVAHLTLNKKINLNAFGLLQTELPEGRDGYSLLLLITATGFKPIQLGLGFTLNGIGGLVGVNRAANVPYLRGLLASGQMDQLLFPANVLDHPAAALAVADGSFPATEGRYVFGLLAKIGWGTPTLLTLELGLIIELPAPVRLVLLGVLRATLPSLDKPILRLRADFVGSVDFGAGSVEFDATLRDSSLLDRFTLSGDGAFRLYQGQHPVFLLTTGGFHPAFQPPANANLRPLQRLRLALADSRDFRLVLQTYLAITSNTVQVGARLDLFVDLPLGFSLEGYLFFDTLFQFNPFRLDVQIGAGVAIKRNGKNKLSLQLYLHVTGPAPWHVTGEVSFRFIWKVSYRIDRTIGGGAPAQPLPNVDVRQLLRQALAAPSSWEVQTPASGSANTVVLRAEPDATRLLVDPSGALVVRQKVAPLAYALERYGNARPQNGNRFDITQARFGQEGNGLLLTGPDLQEVTDFFAPGEFRRMSEAQRLSAPSFQLMRSGVRLPALEGFVGGPATVQKVGYELIVLGSPTPAGTPIIPTPATEAARTGAAPAAAAPASVRRQLVPMPAQQFQQLSQNSAISQAYAIAQPSYLAPEEVYWREDQYVLARADTLTRYAATTYANEAQATAALGMLVAADGRLRGELLVVPAYQLALESV